MSNTSERIILTLLTRTLTVCQTGIPEFVGKFWSPSILVLGNLRVGSDHYDRSNLPFEWITEVFQQIPSPIQKLVLEVTAGEYSQLDATPWTSIDRVIRPDAPQFRALIRVAVLVK